MADVKRTDEIQGEIIHEYDGIEEADNHLPNWWLLTFYGAILFSIGYWFYYHEYEMGPTPSEQYAADVAESASEGEADEQTLLTLAQDQGTISEGRETFETTCAACHGAQAEGEIGPNLTDDAWLHGGAPMDIYTSIRGGISPDEARIEGSAGMPEWGPQLGERRTQAVTAYILSIRGTDVEGREPEGEPYDPDASPAGVEPEADEAQAEPDEADEAQAEPDEADEAQAEPDEAQAEPDEAQAEPDEAQAEPDEAQAEPDEAQAEPDEGEASAEAGEAEASAGAPTGA